MAIKITQIGVGGFDDNFSYIIHDDETRDAYIVDPSGSFLRVAHAVGVLRLSVAGFLLTHTHHDHFDALELAVKEYPKPVYVHKKGLRKVAYENTSPLADKQQISIGSHKINVLHTPGHSPDAVCFYVPAEATGGDPQLITGDTLFVNGCGRASEANLPDLFASLERIKQLPQETRLLPGHDYGPTATASLRDQLTTNPYLKTSNFSEFVKQRLG